MKNLTEYFFEAQNYVIFFNGEKFNIEKNLVAPWLKQFCDKSYFSPAFGVSINEYTLNELKKGLWFEMQFDTINSFAEMSFEKLLINIKPDFYGFNIIRCNNGLYDGRCFYLNLHNSSNQFYNNLLKYVKNFNKQ